MRAVGQPLDSDHIEANPLSADAKRVNRRGLRAYLTPTIVHFGAVLALPAFLSMPHQSVMSLCLGLGSAGAAGLLTWRSSPRASGVSRAITFRARGLALERDIAGGRLRGSSRGRVAHLAATEFKHVRRRRSSCSSESTIPGTSRCGTAWASKGIQWTERLSEIADIFEFVYIALQFFP